MRLGARDVTGFLKSPPYSYFCVGKCVYACAPGLRTHTKEREQTLVDAPHPVTGTAVARRDFYYSTSNQQTTTVIGQKLPETRKNSPS